MYISLHIASWVEGINNYYNYVYSYSVKYPGAISTMIEADYHQKVVMKFSLKGVSSGDLFTPHQAFVRLTNEKTKQEIFFVTEPEASKVFKFDLVSVLTHWMRDDLSQLATIHLIGNQSSSHIQPLVFVHPLGTFIFYGLRGGEGGWWDLGECHLQIVWPPPPSA